jgi:Arc/MetJ-type ribon-helix-helix transcriptional regulator
MGRKILTISLPPEYESFVQWRIKSEGYGSTSEYFRTLIREDRRAVRVERERLEREIMKDMAIERLRERS